MGKPKSSSLNYIESTEGHDFAPIKAILFDFDGTLVGTLDLHYLAYKNVFARKDIKLTRKRFLAALGGKAAEAIPKMVDRKLGIAEVAEIHAEKKQEIDQIFRTAPLDVLGPAFLLQLMHKRMPVALVSSGSRPGIEILLNRLNWSTAFEVIVTGEDVTRGKPDPECYYIASERLRIPCENCLVFEDSAAGLAAARAAGMAAIDVAGPFNIPIRLTQSRNGI